MRILAIVALIWTFKILVPKLYSKNNYSKKNLFKLKTASTQSTQSAKGNQELITIIDKINAYIESLTFLLSKIDKNNPNFKTNIKSLNNRLTIIEQKAKEKHLTNLIDQSQINELKNNIQTYLQAVK